MKNKITNTVLAATDNQLGELSVIETGGSHGFIIVDSHGDRIASVPYDGTGYEKDHAVLFAASPDLLAFAKRMDIYFDDNPEGYDDMREQVKTILEKCHL